MAYTLKVHITMYIITEKFYLHLILFFSNCYHLAESLLALAVSTNDRSSSNLSTFVLAMPTLSTWRRKHNNI